MNLKVWYSKEIQNKYFLEKIRDFDKMQYTNTYTYENIFE